MRGRRSVVERNLRRIHGKDISRKQLDREVDQVFDSYARYWLESFRLPGTHPALIEDGMEVDGYEHIDEALDKGGGVILALPHLGGLGVGRVLARREQGPQGHRGRRAGRAARAG